MITGDVAAFRKAGPRPSPTWQLWLACLMAPPWILPPTHTPVYENHSLCALRRSVLGGVSSDTAFCLQLSAPSARHRSRLQRTSGKSTVLRVLHATRVDVPPRWSLPWSCLRDGQRPSSFAWTRWRKLFRTFQVRSRTSDPPVLLRTRSSE